MTKQMQIKRLQEIECRIFYELEAAAFVDVKKQRKYERVNALLHKMIDKYGF